MALSEEYKRTMRELNAKHFEPDTEGMCTGYVVVWEAYGDWKISIPFKYEADAERHRARNIIGEGKDYNRNSQVTPLRWKAQV